MKEGADKSESVPVDDKERLAIIRPKGESGNPASPGLAGGAEDAPGADEGEPEAA